MKNTVRILVSIIVLLMILGAGIGVVAYFTNGFDFSETQSPADPDDQLQGDYELVLTVNGEQLSVDSELPKEVELRIDVNAEEFTVEILPNGNVSFDFRHNGTLLKFPYIEGNFNEAFGVEIGDGYGGGSGTQRQHAEKQNKGSGLKKTTEHIRNLKEDGARLPPV